MSAASDSGAERTIDEATALARLLEVSRIVLQQAVDLVASSLSTNEQLTYTSKFIPGSTIGKHLRHARDHFVLLMDAIASPPPHVLNYDSRSRNTPMESSREAALEALITTIGRLERVVPTSRMDEQITLHAVTPYPQIMQTTFGRELWFTGLHAIHHWSMVRVISGELGIQLEPSFGFAPSTLVYNGSHAPLGKPKM
ncbi:uncharacterized protein LAESUDRAFT_726188 [Laetiporus sulphureus 93-53]|uniref:DinB-like domain-containing protein n=1 Tax=Laetiporus sulphureus 93-53 TaxID=1314785 RepID=A0A165E6Z0_9APHY|nr:uncharacterized protein LAESUDRAFT_726188 [Laetiporus sulphureus 93-53]KZT06359.1 hypothetical protein LAESUDRAFT_726188 [Laetiporus sulphureus 93-53]